MENIKMGGCYQKKDKTGWLIVGVKRGQEWQTRDIEMGDGIYDEEIRDMNRKDIEMIADLSICYRAYYGKNGRGLYAVWDEVKPHSEKIILQVN